MPRLARPFDSWDVLKLIALALMFIDHSGHFFFTQQQWLRAIGRGAPVIFLFLAGYASSYRFKRDIAGLAVAITFFDVLMTHHIHTQNILFTILLCRLLFDWMERNGRKIERPYEWYVGAIALSGFMIFFQYAGFGMLFALCGYMKRHSQYYAKELQQRFLQLTFITYGLLEAFLGSFTLGNTVLMTLVLFATYQLLWNFEIREIRANYCPAPLTALGKCISRYSGYVYAIQVIVAEWITGITF